MHSVSGDCKILVGREWTLNMMLKSLDFILNSGWTANELTLIFLKVREETSKKQEAAHGWKRSPSVSNGWISFGHMLSGS